MKKYLLIGAALAVAAYWLIDRVGQPPDKAVPTPGSPSVTTVPGATLPPEPAPHAPAVAGDDDGTEIVLGLRVRKDRNCTVELKDYVTPDGEMFSAYSCTPHTTRPPHPYATYSDEALEIMAYSDAEAASLLGKRLIERDTGRSYELLVRAAALDSDFTHLAWLADQAFGTVAVDGELQIDNLKRQYELAALSERLGDISGRTGFLREQLVTAGVGNDELATLDRRVTELVHAMRDIQHTVHGTTSMGGPSDA